MKRPLALTALLVWTVSFPVFAETTTPPRYTINIKEATNAQLCKYGRELYNTGDFKQSAETFKHVLSTDCRNPLAQYYLQKIGYKAPDIGTAEYLKTLPCENYNFDEEDFLPASFYSEHDAGMIFEQFLLYNKRYKHARATLTEQINTYAAMVANLDRNVATLKISLAENNASSATAIAAVKATLESTQAMAKKMDAQSMTLKSELVTAKAAYQKEAAALEAKLKEASAVDTQLHAILTSKDAAITGLKSELAAEKSVSRSGDIAAAHEDLVRKTRTIDEKTVALTTLQEKFEDVRLRLQAIETAISQKNTDIKTIDTKTNTIQK
ncbi:MAG: hypothetical protein HQL19_04245 [Candidatus Omnitrophica bacterium]|nr:hypothetical protein [Candidatus Omnitrophota bacterium]